MEKFAVRRPKREPLENMSKVTIIVTERQVLEKGLNFCPTTKSPDRIKLLDDLYCFCRKLCLKEFFYHPETTNGTTSTAEEQIEVQSSSTGEQNPAGSNGREDEERCEMKSTLLNPYFNPQKEPSHKLSAYLSAVKKDVSELLKKSAHHKSKITEDEGKFPIC